MKNYNQMLRDGLLELQQVPAERDGAKKFLSVLKAAMTVASAAGVPFAGTASVLVGLADAGIAGLNGDSAEIDLDKLFVHRATDDLLSAGIKEEEIEKIIKGD